MKGKLLPTFGEIFNRKSIDMFIVKIRTRFYSKISRVLKRNWRKILTLDEEKIISQVRNYLKL